MKLNAAQKHALIAMTRGSCGVVGPKRARVWCDADPVAKLHHRATFTHLKRQGLTTFHSIEGYTLTEKGEELAKTLNGDN